MRRPHRSDAVESGREGKRQSHEWLLVPCLRSLSFSLLDIIRCGRCSLADYREPSPVQRASSRRPLAFQLDNAAARFGREYPQRRLRDAPSPTGTPLQARRARVARPTPRSLRICTWPAAVRCHGPRSSFLLLSPPTHPLFLDSEAHASMGEFFTCSAFVLYRSPRAWPSFVVACSSRWKCP